MIELQLLAWPRWAQMWALAFTLYFGCKWLTWQQAAVSQAAPWRHTAYLLAWPGMDAAAFLAEPSRTRTAACPASEWLSAIAKICCGLVLLFGVARLVPEPRLYFAGWLGGMGLVLMLHFGVFHLLACAWRRAGVETTPLMRRPLASTSLSEFWGRRWNTAFRDLTHRVIFRPCAARFGARWAVAASFLFSGVIHDLVISVPAHGGYGGPTIYFAIQGAGVLLERSSAGRRIGLPSGSTGRMFAAFILLAPAPLLFHRPFMLGVIVPFMRVLGAL